jgi:hypothetical protein
MLDRELLFDAYLQKKTIQTQNKYMDNTIVDFSK